MEPNAERVSEVAFASIYHPNGLHQTLPVGPSTRFTGLHTSQETGLKYFTTFFLDPPAINASFTFKKWCQAGELEPVSEQKGQIHYHHGILR